MMMTRMLGAEAEEGLTEFLWQRHTVMPPFKQTTHDPTIYDDHRLDHDDDHHLDHDDDHRLGHDDNHRLGHDDDHSLGHDEKIVFDGHP